MDALAMVTVGIVVVVAIIIAMRRRARCPACRHRGHLAVVGSTVIDGQRYKRVACTHCKAEFAHVDGGYVPIKAAGPIEEKAAP
jgi:DNA-directed RNA polymerase subunit RPC12/RpoP